MGRAVINQNDRRTYIGSSDAASVAGLDPFRSRYETYHLKTGEATSDDTISDKPEVKAGVLLEPVVARMYELGMNSETAAHQAFATNKDHPFIASHIDALVVKKKRTDKKGGLEIKTTSSWNADKWGEEMTGDVPDRVAIQCIHHMLAHDLDFVDVAVLFHEIPLSYYEPLVRLLSVDDLARLLMLGDYRVYRLQRDAKALSHVRDMEAQFWADVKARRTPPPNYRHARMGPFLKRRHGLIDKTVQADQSATKAGYAHRDLAEKIKTLTGDRDAAKNFMLDFMGDASTLALPDGSGFKRTINKRGVHTLRYSTKI